MIPLCKKMKILVYSLILLILNSKFFQSNFFTYFFIATFTGYQSKAMRTENILNKRSKINRTV